MYKSVIYTFIIELTKKYQYNEFVNKYMYEWINELRKNGINLRKNNELIDFQ